MTAITVRIVKNWDFPDLMAQSPGGRGVWNGIRFLETASRDSAQTEADFVVVLNQPAAPISLAADPSRVWAVIQEPPTRYHRYLQRGQPVFSRVYMTDPTLANTSPRYVGSQPALAWHAGLSFDTLDAMTTTGLPAKTRDVSWITSTLSFLPGHKVRMRMIERLRDTGLVEFFGRGLAPIERKWEGLAPYRYSIAFENHIGPWYWSEKIADCFLAGCMPIYIGCTNLEDYFPKASFVRLDPHSADPAAAVRRIIESDLAEKNRDAILEARHRVLHQHQLFPFIANEIAAFTAPPERKQRVDIGVRRIDNPLVYGMAVWHWKVKPLLPASVKRLLP